MTRQEKHIFVRNIIRCIIGILLLWSCLGYLRDHPAEKVALYSGFKSILQKGEILLYNLLGKNGELLSQKYALEEKYLSLIHDSEEQGCNDAEFLHELHDTYDAFVREDKNQIEHYITKYMIMATDYDLKIYNDCKEY